jgi:hypothetical protein
MPSAMTTFSRRTPDDQRPNRLAAARERLGEPAFDLTESNPTRCRLPYPDDLLEALADLAALPAGAEGRSRPRPAPAVPRLGVSSRRSGSC